MKDNVCPRCRGSKTEGIMMDMGRIDLDEPCKKCHGTGKTDSKFGIKPTGKEDEIRKAFEETYKINIKLNEDKVFFDAYFEKFKSGYKSRDKQITELEDGYISYRNAYCEAESKRLELEERLIDIDKERKMFAEQYEKAILDYSNVANQLKVAVELIKYYNDDKEVKDFLSTIKKN